MTADPSLWPQAYSSIIQWSSNNETVNNFRIYYITPDNKVIEGSRPSTSAQWVYNELPGIKAYHKSPIVAGVHQRTKGSPGEVEIRLFYEEPEVSAWYEVPDGQVFGKRRMRSAFYKPETQWKVDEDFYDNVGFVAQPGSAISWVDKQGRLQWRLYFISQAPDDEFSPSALLAAVSSVYGVVRVAFQKKPIWFWRAVSKNTIYEAAIDTDTGRWRLSNGSKPIAVATQAPRDLGSVAAISWDAGARVSVFWWDTKGDFEGVIRESRWREDKGWSVEPQPHKSWAELPSVGRLAAVTWPDAKGVTQIRLYAAAALGSPRQASIYEYQADARGWVGGRSDKFSWADRNYSGLRPISAVVWTGPQSRDDVHIRVLNVGFAPANTGAWGLYQGQFDTGVGWRDSGKISA